GLQQPTQLIFADRLGGLLQSAVANYPGVEVVVRPNGSVPFERVMQTMQIVQQSDIRILNMAEQPAATIRR
ncbi:MAG: hypothetical protein AAFP69_22655, partial [Planctomycetota bacterium]